VEAIDPRLIRDAGAELGLTLSEAQAQRLAQFAALLLRWNAVYNLTAIESPQAVVSHHLLDSLAVVPHLPPEAGGRPLRVLDVGAGGGLPGIPLAVARPDASFTLLDRVGKKTAFLEQVRLELDLRNIEVVRARVQDYRAAAGFDVIVSRAFAAMADMVRLTWHLIAPDGCWIAMKGAYPAEEVDQLPASVELVRTVTLRVPLLDADRHLVVLRPR
jgi:16S rRNA (guanine527-N7)-methyltransferase